MSLRRLLTMWVLCAMTSAPALAQPPSRAAAEKKIRDLVQARQLDAALAAYDEYVGAASHLPDAPLLAIVARAQLDALAASSDPATAADALERLAVAGDDRARATLRERAAAGGSDASDALFRLGDKMAVDQMTTLLRAAPPDRRVALIESLQKSGSLDAGKAAAAFLGDQSPQVRSAAAQTVGILGVRDAVPTLQRMFERDEPTVKMFAGLALKRLGQTSVDAYVADLLSSDVPEMRLRAATAYKPSESKVWLPAVRDLRTSQNPTVRLQAAERLACCDAPTARVVLLEALSSPIPMVRDEAARILDVTNVADAKDARRLMGDAAETPRLRGAGIALRLARASERPGKR